MVLMTFLLAIKERLQGIENKITFHANDVDTYCSSHSTKFDIIINAAAIAPLPENQVNHNRSLAVNVGTVGSHYRFYDQNRM